MSFGVGYASGLGTGARKPRAARASRSAQPSANGPTYATWPISCFRLRHCRFADLRAGQPAGACCGELEQKADRNCSGSTFSLPYCFYYYYYYHDLALPVFCPPPPPPHTLTHTPANPPAGVLQQAHAADVVSTLPTQSPTQPPPPPPHPG